MKGEKIIAPKQIAIGYFTFAGINFAIKFLLDPFIVHQVNGNILKSFLFIFIASFTIRYIIILIYDEIKIDWLSIENHKAKKEVKGKENHIIKRIKKLKKLGNGFLMVTLICLDPVVTILYYRPGHFEWNGFHGKYKKIFFFFFNITKILFILSNIVCTLITGSIVLGLIRLI